MRVNTLFLTMEMYSPIDYKNTVDITCSILSELNATKLNILGFLRILFYL